MPVRRQQLCVFLVAIGVTACVDTASDITDPASLTQAQSASTVDPVSMTSEFRNRIADRRLTQDALFRAVSEVEPWFAGVYVQDGELRVVSTDVTIGQERATEVTDALLQVAGRPRLIQTAGTVRLVEGTYSFVELHDWLLLMRPVFHQFGVHRVSISELANKIVLGIESEGMSSAILEWMSGQNIPGSAVRMEVHEPARLDHHWGGHAVDVRLDAGLGVVGCSLTQVVQRRLWDGSPANELYGITSSHCTLTFGSSGSDAFVVGSEFIADAVWDHPVITDSRCEALTGTTVPRCRYSDAALFEYRSSFANQLNLHKVRPQLDSLHTEYMPFVGEVVNKYGRATALTGGTIVDTCVDVFIPAQDHHTEGWGLLCQNEASYHSGEGDSGGPVFLVEDWGEPWGYRWMFVGIHSFRLGGNGFYSTAHNVWQEIVPDEPGWGTICLSFPEAVPGSMTCQW